MKITPGILILMCILLSGCFEKNVEDPERVYNFWPHEKFPEGTSIKKARYWKSAHFTYEYDIHFELKPKRGKAEFMTERRLFKLENFYLSIPSSPGWFPAPDNSNLYRSSLDDAYYIIPPDSNSIYVTDAHY
ncbi:MAG: hypothetical protein H7Y86_11695 [Rhizobacter sp.]|nr:hypothetical protein [Ferruginibacter sp.]